MFHLKKYLLSKLSDEVIFFFGTFYSLSVAFSIIRHTFEFSIIDPKLILSTSVIFSPFVVPLAFFFSLHEISKNIYRRMFFLEIFGRGIKGIFPMFFILSIFVFSVELILMFKIVPQSLRLVKENYAKVIRSQIVRHNDKVLLVWDRKLLVAKDIKIGTRKIELYNGFLYDGNNSISFEELSINIPTTDSRFSKDFVELLFDEGKKGRREIIYNISYSLSSISCTPYFLFSESPAPLLCFAAILAGAKLLRDTIKTNKELLLLCLVTHIIVFLTGIILMLRRKFIK